MHAAEITPKKGSFEQLEEQLEEAFVCDDTEYFVHHKYNNEGIETTSFLEALESPSHNDGDLHLHQCASEPINVGILRSVAIKCGSTVVSLRFASMAVTDKMVEGILPHLTKLRHLQFDGINIGSQAVRALTNFCHNTLVSLRVRGCPLITSESLGWMAGTRGHNSPRLHRLKALDIAFTNVDDRGLAFLTQGLRQLECLDMQGCQISFTGYGIHEKLREGSFSSMTVLNCRGCWGIGDGGVVAIAQAMSQLRHLNLGSCGRITDKSASAIGKGCIQLKSLNIEGALDVTDVGLGMIASHTKLNLINITGCSVSRTSLLAVIHALGYVQESTAFIGFVIRDYDARVSALKGEELSDARVRQNQAAHSIQGGWKVKRHTIHQMQSAHEWQEHQAALRIQSFISNSKSRKRFNEMIFQRTATLSSINIQKTIRGWLGRRRLKRLIATHRTLTHCATMVQARYRGSFVRSRDTLVMPAVLALRAAWLFEKRTNASIILQCFWRSAMALSRLRSLRRNFMTRRRSSILIQRIGRSMFGRRRLKKFRLFAELYLHYCTKMSTRIQCFVRQYLARRRLDERLELASEKHLMQHQSARKIQSFCRGVLARKQVHARRRAWNAAAVEIQRIVRGRKVPEWQDIKAQAIRQHVRDKADLEHANSLGKRLDYTRQPKGRAEEPDDTSLTGMPREEELLKYVFGHSFSGLRCLVYWPAIGLYKQGSICAYNDRMRLWQIDYDEDDNEWLDVVGDQDRILVKEADRAHWIPLSYCRPLPLTRYLEKRKALEPSNSTWTPQETPEKISSDIWYCAYVARGLLDDCYRAKSHEALQKLRDASLVKALTVCIAKMNYLHSTPNGEGYSEMEQFQTLLSELEEYIGMNN